MKLYVLLLALLAQQPSVIIEGNVQLVGTMILGNELPSCQVAWTPPDVLPAAYHVYRARSGYDLTFLTASMIPSLTDYRVSPGSTYIYFIKPANADGTETNKGAVTIAVTVPPISFERGPR